MSFTALFVGLVALGIAAVVGGVPISNQTVRKTQEEEEEEEKPLFEKDKKSPRTTRLLITGFGSFGNYPDAANPSSKTASRLHGRILTSCPPSTASTTSASARPTPPSSNPISITFLGPLPVSYPQISSLVPPLHESGDWDCIIHCGVASGSKAGVRLETRARRDGYVSKGSDGVPANAKGVEGWPKGKEVLRTKVDAEGCREWLEREMGVEHIVTSDDAGRYLCEFIYGSSLAASLSSPYQIPVLFVHVPDLRPADKTYKEGDPLYTEEEVSEVLLRICWYVGNGGR